MQKLSSIFFCAVLGISLQVRAQTSQDDATWTALQDGLKASPLVFEPNVLSRDQGRQFKNQVVTPVGTGPFPAVLLLASCAGVNEALEARARELLDAGFAVLAVDTMGPRRKSWWHCPEVSLYVLGDTYAGLAHLQKLDVIDKKRIYAAGWSTGAAGPTLAASPQARKTVGSAPRFAAVVAHYANCAYQDSPKVPLVRNLRRDSDTPVLMLIAESDVPVSNCFPVLEELKAGGLPVEWHVFQGAHHLWDRPDETRRNRENGFGQKITFKHDPEVTRQASQKMIEFFNKPR